MPVPGGEPILGQAGLHRPHEVMGFNRESCIVLVFRQLFDAMSSTYTYLLGDNGEAVIIDPVFENAARGRTDFQQGDPSYMNHLGLPHPKLMESLPVDGGAV